jgi:hypothetical protein
LLADENKTQNLVVTDIQLAFMSMVFFMVKWVIAAILILTMPGALTTGILSNFAGR